jgi:hypothetical protein
LKRCDGRVSDDELTPVVFRDEQVVGWGRDFLKQIYAHVGKEKKQEAVQIK